MKQVLAAFLLLTFVGCDKSSGSSDEQPAAPPAGSSTPSTSQGSSASAAAFEARSLFQSVCATCHGPDGKGNGVAAAALDPKPRNYTDKAWQASVTDDDLRKIILFGGAAVGKSAVMPGTPQLKDKPEQLTALIQIIRAFGK